MLKIIQRSIKRFHSHLTDIDKRVEYPVLMAKPLPRGVDLRGDSEMRCFSVYEKKLAERQKEMRELKRYPVSEPSILDASSDPSKAGFRPVGLMGFEA
jgi:hypothetical protein